MWSAGRSFISREYITSGSMKLPASFSWINVSVCYPDGMGGCLFLKVRRPHGCLPTHAGSPEQKGMALIRQLWGGGNQPPSTASAWAHSAMKWPVSWRFSSNNGSIQSGEESLSGLAEYDTSDSGLHPLHLRVPYSIYCCSSSTSFILSFHFISILLYSWTNMCKFKNFISLAA